MPSADGCHVVNPEQRERGQISLLILGFTVIALMLIIGGVDVTAVQWPVPGCWMPPTEPPWTPPTRWTAGRHTAAA